MIYRRRRRKRKQRRPTKRNTLGPAILSNANVAIAMFQQIGACPVKEPRFIFSASLVFVNPPIPRSGL